MTDHPVLMPVPGGPVAGIVSEPGCPPRAALLVLQGDGRPGRSGVNAVWTRFARQLADDGLLVLRFDYVGEGDGTMLSRDAIPDPGEQGRGEIVLLRGVVAWLRERTGIEDLLVFGDCLGGRLAIKLAQDDPGVVGAFASVPYVRAEAYMDLELRRRPVGSLKLALGRIDRRDFHPDVLEAIPSILERRPVWMLVGEGDGNEPQQLERLLGPAGRGLEIEVVPGIAVHPVSSDRVRAEVTRRVRRRLLREVERLELAGAGQAAAAAQSATAPGSRPSR